MENKSIQITRDRDRIVSYNGLDISLNTYQCGKCNDSYVMNKSLHWFCPNCGTKYEDFEDVSV